MKTTLSKKLLPGNRYMLMANLMEKCAQEILKETGQVIIITMCPPDKNGNHSYQKSVIIGDTDITMFENCVHIYLCFKTNDNEQYTPYEGNIIFSFRLMPIPLCGLSVIQLLSINNFWNVLEGAKDDKTLNCIKAIQIFIKWFFYNRTVYTFHVVSSKFPEVLKVLGFKEVDKYTNFFHGQGAKNDRSVLKYENTYI